MLALKFALSTSLLALVSFYWLEPCTMVWVCLGITLMLSIPYYPGGNTINEIKLYLRYYSAANEPSSTYATSSAG